MAEDCRSSRRQVSSQRPTPVDVVSDPSFHPFHPSSHCVSTFYALYPDLVSITVTNGKDNHDICLSMTIANTMSLTTINTSGFKDNTHPTSPTTINISVLQ